MPGTCLTSGGQPSFSVSITVEVVRILSDKVLGGIRNGILLTGWDEDMLILNHISLYTK